MNSHRRFFISLGLMLLALCSFAQAQTGSISGRVQNQATGQYLNNARVTVKGSNVEVFTDDTGVYRIFNAPAGSVTLEVFYSGLDPQQVSVNVPAGQNVERDVNLTNKASYGDNSGVLKLDAFVASTSKLTEGEALATNEQRFAPNIKNVVATDAYGDVIEGNVAEFMKNLPGISVDYSDVMPLAVSVRGFDPNMTNVTFDGAMLANASRDATTRQFDFMQVSINNISRVEVTKVPRPQDVASGISGSVNMVSKSAFDRGKAQLNYRVFLSASSDGMMIKKQPFPYDTWERRVNPGFDFDYTMPITKDFGLVLTALHSKAWNEQNYTTNTWNGTAAGTGATPAKPFLQSHQLIDAPKWYERNSIGLHADWRVTPNSVLSLGLQATYYVDTNGNVNRTVSVGTNATSTLAGGTPLSYGQDFAHSATGRGTSVFASNLLHIDARTLAANGRWRWQNHGWTVQTDGNVSTSKTWMRLVSKGNFNNYASALANTTGVRVNFDQITPEGPKQITAFDQNNRPIDLLDLHNYVLNTATDGVIRNHRDDSMGTAASVKRSFNVADIPTSLQIGTDLHSQDREHRRQSRVYTYNGMNGDRSLAPFAMQVYTPRRNYFDYDYINWPSPNRMVEAWGKDPSLFTQTLANQVTTEANRINGSENFKEITTAYYIQGEARFFHNKLQVLTGVRFEKFHDKAAGPLFDPDAAFQRDANGKFITVGGARVRKPEAGAAGSLEELKLIRKELGNQIDSTYDGYYPSLHLTYNVTSNFLLRAAYAKTYGKADFVNIIPNTTVDENETYNSATPTPGSYPGVLIVGNPQLKPWKADNYDLSAEYYTDSGGVFSLGAYRKNIADFHDSITGVTATPALLNQLGLDPNYLGWEVRTTVNGGDARVDGMEANIRQSLKLLGGWGRYVSVFANGTKLKLYGSRNASFTRFIPETFNYGFTITRNPVTFALKWNGRGEQRRAVSAAQGPDASLFEEKRTTTDLNFTWQFRRQISLFINGRNIFNVHYTALRYGSETPDYAKINATRSYGVQWAAGFKGTF